MSPIHMEIYFLTNTIHSFPSQRTAAEIAREQDVDMASLKDPQTDKERVQGDPKW